MYFCYTDRPLIQSDEIAEAVENKKSEGKKSILDSLISLILKPN
jgi:hypothetical protein